MIRSFDWRWRRWYFGVTLFPWPTSAKWSVDPDRWGPSFSLFFWRLGIAGGKTWRNPHGPAKEAVFVSGLD